MAGVVWGRAGIGSVMGLFLGTHINKVDRKGRVSVPAQFRAALADQAFAGIILYPSPVHEAVIVGCGMGFLERMAAASSNSFDVFSDEQDDLGAAIFGSAVQLPWDPEGRVGLPEHLLAHAGIGEQVAFVGKGVQFQLWQPEAHKIHEAEAKTRIKLNKPKLILRNPEGT